MYIRASQFKYLATLLQMYTLLPYYSYIHFNIHPYTTDLMDITLYQLEQNSPQKTLYTLLYSTSLRTKDSSSVSKSSFYRRNITFVTQQEHPPTLNINYI